MIEWISTTVSAITAGLVVYQLESGRQWRKDIESKIDALGMTASRNRENLKGDIADLRVDRAEQYVRKSDCTDVRRECVNHMKETIKDPICRKLDEIQQQRAAAWTDHEKDVADVWNVINHHTHSSLPRDDKVIGP